MTLLTIDEAFTEGCAAIVGHEPAFRCFATRKHDSELEVEMQVLDTVFVTCAVEML